MATLAGSGVGKTSSSRGPLELISHLGMLGSGHYRSAQGIYFDMDDGFSEIPKRHKGKSDYEDLERLKNANHRRVDVADEFSGILRKMNEKNAAAHQSGISETMCKMFSASSGLFDKGRVSGSNATIGPEIVKESCISFWGLTTIDGFTSSVVKANFIEGLISRMILIFADSKTTTNFNTRKFDVEHWKIEMDKIMNSYEKHNASRKNGFLDLSPREDCQEVRQLMEAHYSFMLEAGLNASSMELRVLLKRSCEYVSILALILCVMRGDDQIRMVDVENAEKMMVIIRNGTMAFVDRFREGVEDERGKDVEFLWEKIKKMSIRSGNGKVNIKDLKKETTKIGRKYPGYRESLFLTLKDEDKIEFDKDSKSITVKT